jgi:four helix bundle protein
MATIERFEQLVAWQKAHALVLDVYRLSRVFPREELYGITRQLRRAAVSVPANIAEGFKRQSRSEKVRFYNISEASLEEARYYLRLATDLDLTESPHQLIDLADEVARLLNGLIASVRAAR